MTNNKIFDRMIVTIKGPRLMNDKIKIFFSDKSSKEYEDGVTYYEISKEYKKRTNKILGVKVNNEIVPLHTKAKHNDQAEFITIADIDGYKMNQSGLKFVLEVESK